MMTMTKTAMKSWNGNKPGSEEQRHALVLQAWEAINSERELEGVLAAVAKVLVPVVPFFAVAVIVPEAKQEAPWAMHIVGTTKGKEENMDEFEHRMGTTQPPLYPVPSKTLIPYCDSELDEVKKSGAPYICNDLFAKEAWLPHEFKLAAAGIHAYTSIPLQVRGRGIGVLVFSRRQPDAFLPEQMIDFDRSLALDCRGRCQCPGQRGNCPPARSTGSRKHCAARSTQPHYEV